MQFNIQGIKDYLVKMMVYLPLQYFVALVFIYVFGTPWDSAQRKYKAYEYDWKDIAYSIAAGVIIMMLIYIRLFLTTIQISDPKGRKSTTLFIIYLVSMTLGYYCAYEIEIKRILGNATDRSTLLLSQNNNTRGKQSVSKSIITNYGPNLYFVKCTSNLMITLFLYMFIQNDLEHVT